MKVKRVVAGVLVVVGMGVAAVTGFQSTGSQRVESDPDMVLAVAVARPDSVLSMADAAKLGLLVPGASIRAKPLLVGGGLAYFSVVELDGGGRSVGFLEHSPCAVSAGNRACTRSDGGVIKGSEEVLQLGQWRGPCETVTCTIR